MLQNEYFINFIRVPDVNDCLDRITSFQPLGWPGLRCFSLDPVCAWGIPGKGLWGKLPLQGSAETKDCGGVLREQNPLNKVRVLFSGKDVSVSGNFSSFPLS